MKSILEIFQNLFRRKPKASVSEKPVVSRIPYDKRTEKLYPLSAVLTIVPRHQEDFFQDAYFEIGAALNLVIYAHSNPPQEILEFLGADEVKKSILLTLGRSEYADAMMDRAQARFSTSTRSRGIACSFPIRGVAGVAVYKFLADQSKPLRLGQVEERRRFTDMFKRIGHTVTMDIRRDQTEEEPEVSQEQEQVQRIASVQGAQTPFDVVFAIVNKGYTDLVMEASRRAGARGGTILAARGTGNPEMERFYGFSITPDKEIVVILVKRSLTEAVLKSIYDEAGLSTNGQGIVFSVPAGRTAGLTAQKLPSNSGAGVEDLSSDEELDL